MYYLYRHIRLDKNEVFYIGIGKTPSERELKKLGHTYRAFHRRAYEKKKSRNIYWKNIINKTDYLVEILFYTDDVQVIQQKEVEFIELYKPTLCNLTEGGFGIQSYSHTEESKAKIGAAFRGKKLSREHAIKSSIHKHKPVVVYKDDVVLKFNSIKEATQFLGINTNNVSACIAGKRATAHGYKFRFQEVVESKDKEL